MELAIQEDIMYYVKSSSNLLQQSSVDMCYSTTFLCAPESCDVKDKMKISRWHFHMRFQNSNEILIHHQCKQSFDHYLHPQPPFVMIIDPTMGAIIGASSPKYSLSCNF